MSIESIILAQAAAESQRILAPMADPENDGDFTVSTLAGTFTGTMSIFDKVLVPTANGMEEQRQIKISAVISQFTASEKTTLLAAPEDRARSVAKGLNWTLTAVEPGAQFYVLTGVAI